MLYRLASLAVLFTVLAGCAQIAVIGPQQDPLRRADRELTLIYTGYGRGNVDPAEDCG